jgi:hypothetical protein
MGHTENITSKPIPFSIEAIPFSDFPHRQMEETFSHTPRDNRSKRRLIICHCRAQKRLLSDSVALKGWPRILEISPRRARRPQRDIAAAKRSEQETVQGKEIWG